MAALLPAVSSLGQSPSCPVVTAGDPSPAAAAYAAAHYSQAEGLYQQELVKHPDDPQLSAALVRIWLREGEAAAAVARVNRVLAQNPNSAITLTSLAEVQLYQGQPWLALETLKKASAADPCYARIHLIRARALRIDSMYASERAEIQSGYDIDPTDSDIRHAYLGTVAAAHEIEGIDHALKTSKDLDADTRQKAEESIRSMMPLLFENNQTCQVLPTNTSATFVLQASYTDMKHIDGYRLDVDLPKSKVKLLVDTAASGLFISRAIADENGFQAAVGDPPGTVRADSVRIGPLEFRNCVVGVSETPFAGKADGFIGTDMFASWLITLDQPRAKLVLEPLPAVAGIVPGDRPTAPELRGFMPVYQRQQYLLVPVMLDSKLRKLFVLDTGIRFSAMTPEAAHSVSTMKVNFTNSMQTVSGGTIQIYRDNFDFQVGDLSLPHQGHILQLDTSTIDQNAGFQVAGMLGFDILHSLAMHLDYRDGLVKFESSDAETSPHSGTGPKGIMTASDKIDCGPEDTRDRPVGATIEAKVTGLLDSAHLKPGKDINVTIVNEWSFPGCILQKGSVLYGHVTAASTSKTPDSSELSLVFDHGECDGGPKKRVSLQVIGLVASPDEFVGRHTVMPVEVRGGGRDISNAAHDMGMFSLDENLNPGGPPHTVHPGIVAGLPKIKLEPHGGPECSTRMTSTDRSIRLGVGSELILTMASARQ